MTVTAPSLDHFTFDTIATPQFAAVGFTATIRARDAANNPFTSYTGTANLSISGGTVSPTSITFTNGVWIGTVTITGSGTGRTLSVEDGTVTGISNVFDVTGVPDHILITPASADVIVGVTQQFSATAYDFSNNPIPNQPFIWSVVAGGGTINSSGLFTAGVTPGIFTNTVQAASGSVIGHATVNVTSTVLHHFSFDTIPSPRFAGVAFTATIRARDAANNPVVTYNGTASLSLSAGTVSPTSITFVNGVWTGSITIPATGTGLTLNVQDGTACGTSNVFDVNTPVCPCSIWGDSGTPGMSNDTDGQAIQVGVKFRSSMDGYITGIRF